MAATVFDYGTEEVLDTDEGPCSHIVKGKDGKKGTDIVLEARIYGTPVEALCGYVWIPSRDPKKYPVCQKCKEIAGLYQSVSGWGAPIPS